MKGMMATKFERQHTEHIFEDNSDQALIRRLRNEQAANKTASS